MSSTFSSTTDDQAAVDQAADYTPNESTGGATYITSTTDDEEDAVRAAQAYDEGKVFVSNNERTAGALGVAIGERKKTRCSGRKTPTIFAAQPMIRSTLQSSVKRLLKKKERTKLTI